EAWEKYMALSPAPAEACPALPLAYAQLRQPERALAAYERCARMTPDDADALMDLGKAYESAGRHAEARAALERAAAIDPDNPLPRRLLEQRAGTAFEDAR